VVGRVDVAARVRGERQPGDVQRLALRYTEQAAHLDVRQDRHLRHTRVDVVAQIDERHPPSPTHKYPGESPRIPPPTPPPGRRIDVPNPPPTKVTALLIPAAQADRAPLPSRRVREYPHLPQTR